ncbi:hypothetical protein TNCV_2278491 [Trichonephila clavipes]|uniref:Uncharacterized protein n=1 Tax=Trichonephila clavipes TaxID=2585209 RepID=A0A8X6V092_TRICX|nr:hypothetical protein TNCV_2278491 [Trichonephila clavipes]
MDPQPRNLAQLATALESAWLNIPENTFRDVTLFLHVSQQSALRKVVILAFDRWVVTIFSSPNMEMESGISRKICKWNMEFVVKSGNGGLATLTALLWEQGSNPGEGMDVCIVQGWRTNGTRANDGTRQNILGTPSIKNDLHFTLK